MDDNKRFIHTEVQATETKDTIYKAYRDVVGQARHLDDDLEHWRTKAHEYKLLERDLATAKDMVNRLKAQNETLRADVEGFKNTLNTMNLMYTRLHSAEDEMMRLMNRIQAQSGAPGP